MRPLVAVRSSTAYDPGFLERSPLLWPLRRAARCLEGFCDFPPPSVLDGVFEGEPPVRFVAAAPRARRHRRPVLEAAALYDGRITLERAVPTRDRSWHDLVNALVWGTFPAAKLALHARQHRAITERLAPGARTLPPTRTREQDALALVDEGGVVLLAGGEGDPRHGDAVVFGHAVYESVILGVAPAVVAAVVLPASAEGGNILASVDAQLAAMLADRSRFVSPEELFRVDLGELVPPLGVPATRKVVPDTRPLLS